MIKLMREGARKYPWFLKSVMGVLAVAFVITMGWWGFGDQEPNSVASIGDLSVTRDEFQRAYQNTYRFYQDKVPGDFKDEVLKEFVLESLVESKLWSLAAQEMGLTITPAEIRDDILTRPEFQQNGKFDPDLYRRVLAANRLTPALFESVHMMELLQEKAKTVILDSVALTPSEIAEAQALMAHQPQGETTTAPSARDRILQDFLFQKGQRALLAYKEAMKVKVPIRTRKELL